MTGGTLILASMLNNLTEVVTIMEQENVSVTCATPTEYLTWFRSGHGSLQRCTTWQLSFCGGENISTGMMRDFTALGNKNLEFVSNYGGAACPNTACMGAVAYREFAEDPEGQPIPAGHPSAGYQVWIAESLGRPVPAG